MRQIEITYKPSWMVVMVRKTRPTPSMKVTGPLWMSVMKNFDPPEDWIRRMDDHYLEPWDEIDE